MHSKKIITPNKITLLRIILSFVILSILCIEYWWNSYLILSLIWFLIIFNEITDIIDGYIARKYGLISNVGKILDPYADVLQHLTYFVFFFYKGITPYYFFVIFVYRELSVGVIRNLIIQFNIIQQARISGKIKSLFYAIAVFASLLLYTFDKLKIITFVDGFISSILNLTFSFSFIVAIIYVISAFVTVISLIDYVMIFLDLGKYEK
ncbi:CDP-diacylglycerol--glycerol-3-phosphate 3-phosphatidyltransferase [Borrelia crocidurae]|uniref:CDP-diacylglycerol--glycerol-3-phosphate 3-phosphatidyltransferase n=1 Tax=Borrelia crocidurae TaxID=29520 RepID=UPI00058D8B0E|nr:CDP-diacylglycerol--glycerol-3-phosphate 3-phosphatidyltransferase [Borrelia crocidurae]